VRRGAQHARIRLPSHSYAIFPPRQYGISECVRAARSHKHIYMRERESARERERGSGRVSKRERERERTRHRGRGRRKGRGRVKESERESERREGYRGGWSEQFAFVALSSCRYEPLAQSCDPVCAPCACPRALQLDGIAVQG